MNDLNDIPLLKRAILAMHGCQSEHSRTASVTEMWERRIVSEGRVEVFTLHGHEKAREAFAWNYRTEDGCLQSVTVLKIPPVETPSDAVRAAIPGRKNQ